jgi:hypothetical protein
MNSITFQVIEANDLPLIECIADWYAHEWHIPVTKTIAQLANLVMNKHLL